jgi:hypothetical protein
LSNNNPDEVLRELKRITKILTLSNSDKLRTEIERFATSDDRKKMWVLIDGNRQSNDIASAVNFTKRGVDKYLFALEQAGLIDRSFSKPPRRTIDYVPAEWIELLGKSQESEPGARESIDDKPDALKPQGEGNG